MNDDLVKRFNAQVARANTPAPNRETANPAFKTTPTPRSYETPGVPSGYANKTPPKQ